MREIAQLELQHRGARSDRAARVPRRRRRPVDADRPARARPLPEHLPREAVVHPRRPAAAPTAAGACAQLARTSRDAGVRAGELQGDPARAAEARLRALRADRAGAGAVAADRARPGGPRPAGACAGGKVRRSPAAVPAEPDLRPRGRRAGSLDVGGLGGRRGALLQPLVDALGRYVLGAGKLHADDTPVPVLARAAARPRPGGCGPMCATIGRPATSRAAGGVVPLLARSQGRAAAEHLASFARLLQADGYAGFDRLYGDAIVEAACWAHVRRKFYDVYVDEGLPDRRARRSTASAALRHRGRHPGPPPGRATSGAPGACRAVLEDLHHWLHTTLPTVSRSPILPIAIRYALSRWTACPLSRRWPLEIDNNAAERRCARGARPQELAVRRLRCWR